MYSILLCIFALFSSCPAQCSLDAEAVRAVHLFCRDIWEADCSADHSQGLAAVYADRDRQHVCLSGNPFWLWVTRQQTKISKVFVSVILDVSRRFQDLWTDKYNCMWRYFLNQAVQWRITWSSKWSNWLRCIYKYTSLYMIYVGWHVHVNNTIATLFVHEMSGSWILGFLSRFKNSIFQDFKNSRFQEFKIQDFKISRFQEFNLEDR